MLNLRRPNRGIHRSTCGPCPAQGVVSGSGHFVNLQERDAFGVVLATDFDGVGTGGKCDEEGGVLAAVCEGEGTDGLGRGSGDG